MSFITALPFIAGIFAGIFAPPEAVTPSAWAAEHLVVPDGPLAGERWDPKLTPYVAEIIDTLGPDAPHTFAAVRKSAQTGVSIAAIALIASYIDKAPARLGYVLPTIDLLQEFNSEKLAPTIEMTPALNAKVRPQTSRSATGSTTVRKKFPGGSLLLMNANSAADLRSKTLKVGIGDEVDQWQWNLDGQGDPFDLLKGRFIAFHATGDYRLLSLSTPTVAGQSRIDGQFKSGDQRLWHVRCPQCREEITLKFSQLRYERRPPYAAHYVAQCCGGVIEHREKAALIRAGRFLATNQDGLYPSFHIDALVSQLTTWDKLAEAWVSAEGDETKERAFVNLWLGLPYEIRGDAPDHVRLMERREEYGENVVPPEGLLLVAGVDVQHSGLWVEIVAFAPDRQSWTVSARFLDGDTEDAERGAFVKLAELYDERFLTPIGPRLIDAIAIDAGDGGRSNQVYQFTRGRHRAYAIKGQPGWQSPAIGSPVPVNISYGGKKLKNGAKLWPVGTWSLKGELHANLRKDGIRGGKDCDPPGYCHHGNFLGENYFRQITAEYLADARIRGRNVKVWQQVRENHLLDCRVYAMAMAEHLGLTKNKPRNWQKLAELRGAPASVVKPLPDAAEPKAEMPAQKLMVTLPPRGRRMRSMGIA